MFKGCGRLAAQKSRLEQNPAAELAELFGKWANLEEDFGAPKRLRLFFPSRMFWLFLFQVLSPDGSCRETLCKFLAWLAAEKGKLASVSTASYCKARAKLPLKGIKKLSGRIAQKVAGSETEADLWCGRKVKVIDGACVSMPDTVQNQKAWPQPKGSKAGCGFPVMRLAAIFSLASGALLELAGGTLHNHERTLLRKLWSSLKPGDVALADRGFCGYADFFLLAKRGVDSVMRKHQRRTVGAVVLKRLGKNDYLMEWFKTSRPDWLTEKQWKNIPDKIVVREIKVIVRVKGFRTQTITIATTLTDPVAFPARAFAELYFKRWRVELYLRDIKITMGMDILKCKTPQMVEKELWMRVIAYNLVRAVMLESAITHGLPTERLSFKGTLSTLRQWAPTLSLSHIDKTGGLVLYRAMLYYIAHDTVPFRPNRVEPRAKKRRAKNYQLLNKPRRLFKEIPHRNKYRRP
ncbi:MAG: IS4 family transposase [Elusimicrobiota bacterium]|nr:IS4 family transposase [Elusimicrobiota bacterium]